MRFLAHGGASRAERVRVGDWPEIPSGLLMDARGLSVDAPAFGLGVLQGRPYLIYRELQGDEGEGLHTYTFLLEPRPEDFELYRWNGAWMLASLLADADACSLLLDDPELATEHSLAHALDRCEPIPLTREASPEILSALLARAALEPDRIAAATAAVSLEQPTPLMDFAAALHRVPIAFRTGRGWLVRGVSSHAAILGCGLLLEGPSELSADPTPGHVALARLDQIAAGNPTVAELLATPYPQWDARGQGLMHGLRILEQLETRTAQGWDLLSSVPAREGLLKEEIRTAALQTMERSRQPLPFEPATLLLEDAEAGHRTLPPDVVARLEHGAVVRFLGARGIPPAPWPSWMETPHKLKAELWARWVEAAKDNWQEHATRALADLCPEGEPDPAAFAVVAAGIATARAAGQSPFEWESFAQYPELRTLLADWAIENVKKMRGDWQAGYLALADDPGGRGLANANISSPVAARLVTYMWDALAGPRATKARAWLHALATSPLRDIVPMATKVQLAATAGGPWNRLEQLRLAWDGDVVQDDPAPVEERPYLLRELEQLVLTPPIRTPNPTSLRVVVGADLPETVLRAVARHTKSSKHKSEPQAPAAGVWLKAMSQKLKDAAKEAGEVASKAAGAAAEAAGKAAKEAAEAANRAAKEASEAAERKRREAAEAAKVAVSEAAERKRKPEPAKPKPQPKSEPRRETPARAAEPEVKNLAKKAPPAYVPPPPPPAKIQKPKVLPPPPTPVVEARPAQAAANRPAPPRVPEPNVLEPAVPEPNVIEPTVVAPRAMEPVIEPSIPAASSPPPVAPLPQPPGMEPPMLVRPDLREHLRVWIAGGNAEDDRIGDEELLNLFENGNPAERTAARTIIANFSAGLLYRLAGRSISNPRLLDGCARVLSGATLDRVVRDSIHYDIVRFAKAAAARLALNHGDGWSDAVDQSILRVLRAGNAELRKELNRELMQNDPSLIDDLTRAIDSPASGADAA